MWVTIFVLKFVLDSKALTSGSFHWTVPPKCFHETRVLIDHK